ncbi:MAG: adenylate kinase [Chloroflexota bacterium]|nr:adenylate kinase [Chloroflexota bacterium]
MQRVSVVGTTGSGKTTLARALAAALGCPHIELDALFWGPKWSMAELPVFRSRVASVVAGDAWVIDGGYSDVRDLVWARADTVVWLDYPLAVTLSRLVRRILARIRDGTELWPGTGNRETIRNAVFARDPLVWFAIRTHRGRRRRIAAMLARPEYAHLRSHRFTHPADAERWLQAQRALPAPRI